MPLYEYKCDSCGATFEVIQRFSDPPIETCRACGGPVHKVLSAPAIQFKGPGWYVTDYARKGTTEAGEPSDGKTPSPRDSSKTSPESSSTPASTDSASTDKPKA
jgi:putative FmdB family regulatory protein